MNYSDRILPPSIKAGPNDRPEGPNPAYPLLQRSHGGNKLDGERYYMCCTYPLAGAAFMARPLGRKTESLSR
ncbi:hypothetical protein PRLR6014_17520 [Prevotella lacticifex]|nr:hypothetical protein PRLR6014_17520 [Prevotella lacticifex]